MMTPLLTFFNLAKLKTALSLALALYGQRLRKICLHHAHIRPRF